MFRSRRSDSISAIGGPYNWKAQVFPGGPYDPTRLWHLLIINILYLFLLQNEKSTFINKERWLASKMVAWLWIHSFYSYNLICKQSDAGGGTVSQYVVLALVNLASRDALRLGRHTGSSRLTVHGVLLGFLGSLRLHVVADSATEQSSTMPKKPQHFLKLIKPQLKNVYLVFSSCIMTINEAIFRLFIVLTICISGISPSSRRGLSVPQIFLIPLQF